jgi:hypothetical protein
MAVIRVTPTSIEAHQCVSNFCARIPQQQRHTQSAYKKMAFKGIAPKTRVLTIDRRVARCPVVKRSHGTVCTSNCQLLNALLCPAIHQKRPQKGNVQV